MASWDARRAKDDTNVCLPDPKPQRREKASQSEWAAIREGFYGQCCVSCGHGDHWELHHIVPRSQGGDDVAENLVVLCRTCHTRLESHAPGWERVAAAIRQYVLPNRGRCVYAIQKLGWDRFNKKYPLLSQPDSVPLSGEARESGSESDWDQFEEPVFRYRPPADGPPDFGRDFWNEVA